MSQKKQILSIAKKHCRNLHHIIIQQVNGQEISYMDDCELWISANRDLLPKYFLDNWEEVRKNLNDAVQINEQANKMSNGGLEESRLYDKVTDLREFCRGLLKRTAILIKQQIDSLN